MKAVTYMSMWRGLIAITPPPQTLASILAEVAERHGLTVRELIGPDRARRVAWPRQEVMWLARQRTNLSFPQIARRLGERDHTTILYGVRAYERRRALKAAA